VAADLKIIVLTTFDTDEMVLTALRLGAEAAARLGRLTPRERDVAIAIARGLSNAEIAEAHFVSVTTVKTHVGRILDKLAVGNRVQIAICVHSALN
jgi:DNA-binding NarL/FixJ family response regulator